MTAPTSHSTLPDAELRRAAALLCGYKVKDDKWMFKPWPDEDPNNPRAAGDLRRIYTWLPDQNRDDLARVFVAAFEKNDAEWRATFMEKDMAGKAFGCWRLALTDTRAALCALLDLIQPLEEK
jgi:hypothetical protein